MLLGGGHTHLVAIPLLRRLQPDRPIALLTPSPRLLYSGMMPGWIAGQYEYDDCLIDVREHCRHWRVEWIEAEAADIRFAEAVVVDTGGRRHPYDELSINVGSANEVRRLPAVGVKRASAAGSGAAAGQDPAADPLCIIGVKPFSAFTEAWHEWVVAVRERPGARRLVVVGAGPAAVELAFALVRRTHIEPALTGSRVMLLMDDEMPLAGQSRFGGRLALASLRRAGVQLLAGHRFVGHHGATLHCEPPAAAVAADFAIVATGAQPPSWLARAARRDAVEVADDGGIAVDSRMRSVSTRGIRACGDCASFVDQRVPRSGVHAVRQAPALADSLVRGGAAQPYLAQRRALLLLNRCDGTAIAIRGPLAAAGAWAWRWKDRIDRRFVAGFAAQRP